MPLVYLPVQLRDLTGGISQISLPGNTVREIIKALEAQFPGLKSRLCRDEELAPGLQVTIDSQLSTRGIRAKVGMNSEVHFLPAIGGG